jgi:hypothetical protein
MAAVLAISKMSRVKYGFRLRAQKIPFSIFAQQKNILFAWIIG